jgi:hypothetical protein
MHTVYCYTESCHAFVNKNYLNIRIIILSKQVLGLMLEIQGFDARKLFSRFENVKDVYIHLRIFFGYSALHMQTVLHRIVQNYSALLVTRANGNKSSNIVS